jgi:hypothetical protein
MGSPRHYRDRIGYGSCAAKTRFALPFLVVCTQRRRDRTCAKKVAINEFGLQEQTVAQTQLTAQGLRAVAQQAEAKRLSPEDSTINKS